MSKGTVVIKEIAALATGLAKFVATWPSGKVFTKYVDMGDDVNERRRQEQFAESRGYEVEWDMEGVVFGD